MTVCSAQITLSEAAFKFYGQALIDKQCLQEEVIQLQLLATEQQEICDSVDVERVNQINSLEVANLRSTSIQNNYKATALKQQEQNHLLKTWNKILKSSVVVAVVIIVAEAIIIYVTIINP